jgi:hypothetical protein
LSRGPDAARHLAEAAQSAQRTDSEALALNLDRAAAILDTWLRIETVSADLVA